MVTAEDIAGLRTASRDYVETEQLKADLGRLRQQRAPFFLTEADLERILKWKLGGQYHRGRNLRNKNTDDVIRVVTIATMNIDHSDTDYLLELRVGILTTLRGIGVPVASAVLALTFPEHYSVIDFRGWRQVYGEERRQFSIADYKRYLATLRPLAQQLDWPIQEVDLAIWEYDLRQEGATA